MWTWLMLSLNSPLAGESCGGTLALAVSLKLRDTNFEPMPRMWVLIHPYLQIFDFSLPSYNLTPDRGHKKNIIISWLMYGFGKKDLYSDFINNTHVTLEARQTYNKLMDFNTLDDSFYVEGYTRPGTAIWKRRRVECNKKSCPWPVLCTRHGWKLARYTANLPG